MKQVVKFSEKLKMAARESIDKRCWDLENLEKLTLTS